jgi:glutathione-specific gamma-glutamylcyclotransferase
MSGKTHWVFAYGSLIWRPGFAFLHSEPASLQGWHRSLCVLSHHYRGTKDNLGLVFGLDVGGTCHGLAYEVADEVWAETHHYLTARELITSIYIEKRLPVTLPKSLRQVQALTYVVDPRHEQYAGHLTRAQKLNMIRQAVGEAGPCIDYVQNTSSHLRSLGIADRVLDDLVAAL